MSEEATVAEAKAASTGTSGEALLSARGIVKDYYSVMRDDAGWAPWLLHRVFGFAGAYRDSPKLWEPRPVLRGVDVDVREGEVLAITGKSGAGKSTLLHILGAFDAPSEGAVTFRGQDIWKGGHEQIQTFRNKSVGYVFQFYHLFPDLDAIENVILPATIDPGYGSRRGAVRDRARELLSRVGLDHRVGHRPNQLSGGEQQRVAIARALMMEPEVLLCDEPTGNLDTETGQKILDLLFGLRESDNRTYVIVTHDLEVAKLADRHVAMKDGLIVSTDELTSSG